MTSVMLYVKHEFECVQGCGEGVIEGVQHPSTSFKLKIFGEIIIKTPLVKCKIAGQMEIMIMNRII